MPDFDFRKAMGGKVEVAADDKLADGVKWDEKAAAVSEEESDRANFLADRITDMLMRSCTVAGLGVNGVVGLILVNVARATRENCEHCFREMIECRRLELDQLERGEL
jgi:hypothetical protein